MRNPVTQHQDKPGTHCHAWPCRWLLSPSWAGAVSARRLVAMSSRPRASRCSSGAYVLALAVLVVLALAVVRDMAGHVERQKPSG